MNTVQILLTVERVRRGTRSPDVLDLCDWIELRARQMPLPLEAPPAAAVLPATAPQPDQSRAKEPKASAGSAVTTSGRPAKGSSRRAGARTPAATSEKMDVTGGESAAPKFDKRAYQRDLMRKRRAAAKAGSK